MFAAKVIYIRSRIRPGEGEGVQVLVHLAAGWLQNVFPPRYSAAFSLANSSSFRIGWQRFLAALTVWQLVGFYPPVFGNVKRQDIFSSTCHPELSITCLVHPKGGPCLTLCCSPIPHSAILPCPVQYSILLSNILHCNILPSTVQYSVPLSNILLFSYPTFCRTPVQYSVLLSNILLSNILPSSCPIFSSTV
jgi:hypothetical protein